MFKIKKILEEIKNIPMQERGEREGYSIPLDRFVGEFPDGDQIEVNGEYSINLTGEPAKQKWLSDFTSKYGDKGEAVIWATGPSMNKWTVQGNSNFAKSAQQTRDNISKWYSKQ